LAEKLKEQIMGEWNRKGMGGAEDIASSNSKAPSDEKSFIVGSTEERKSRCQTGEVEKQIAWREW
jgi:hypothetical protein